MSTFKPLLQVQLYLAGLREVSHFRPNVWDCDFTFHSPDMLCWPFHCTLQRERPGRHHIWPYILHRPQSRSSGTEAQADRHECEARKGKQISGAMFVTSTLQGLFCQPFPHPDQN